MSSQSLRFDRPHGRAGDSRAVDELRRHEDYRGRNSAMPAATVRTMRVTVLQFLRRGLTYRDNLDIEREIHAGERVIRIEQDFLSFNCAHDDARRMTVVVGPELVADLEFAVDR